MSFIAINTVCAGNSDSERQTMSTGLDFDFGLSWLFDFCVKLLACQGRATLRRSDKVIINRFTMPPCSSYRCSLVSMVNWWYVGHRQKDILWPKSKSECPNSKTGNKKQTVLTTVLSALSVLRSTQILTYWVQRTLGIVRFFSSRLRKVYSSSALTSTADCFVRLRVLNITTDTLTMTSFNIRVIKRFVGIRNPHPTTIVEYPVQYHYFAFRYDCTLTVHILKVSSLSSPYYSS